MNQKLLQLRESISHVVIGKEKALELVLVGLLAEGHILIDDVPGMGKTLLAKALAASLTCEFKRIQFTPDLTPTDVTGFFSTITPRISPFAPVPCSQTFYSQMKSTVPSPGLSLPCWKQWKNDKLRLMVRQWPCQGHFWFWRHKTLSTKKVPFPYLKHSWTVSC